MFRVVIHRGAHKDLRRLPKKDLTRVWEAIHSLAAHPYGGERLEGDLAQYWSLHVWPYRVIYTVEKEIVTITVVAVGHRQGVYKRLRR